MSTSEQKGKSLYSIEIESVSGKFQEKGNFKMSYNRPVKFELGDVEVKIVLKKVGNSDEIAAQYIDLKNGATIEKYSAQFSTLFEHSSVYMDSEIQKINLKVKK